MTGLHTLIELQKVDSQLLELEQLKGDLPWRVEELSKKVKQISQSLADSKARVKEIEGEIKKIHVSKETKTEKVTKLQDQLYLVKTNRQYDALTSEIDYLKNQMSEEEARQLGLVEEKDRLDEQVKFESLQMEQIEEELNKQNQKLEETISSSEVRLKELRSRRNDLVPLIEFRYLAMYDRIRTARDGRAVVPVVSRSCGGCHSQITLQLLAEVKTKARLINCPACRRFLYWPEVSEVRG